MIVVANRVPVNPERAAELEERFCHSGGGGAGQFPRFIRSEVQRPIQGESGGEGLIAGHPVLEILEVIQANGVPVISRAALPRP